MPDLSNCELVDGKYYCWDNIKKQFVEVDAQYKYLDGVPSKVLQVFIDKGILKVTEEMSNA
jgi:hypothetical protein